MNPAPTKELVDQFYGTSQNYKFWSDHMYPQSRVERLNTIHRDRSNWVLDFLSRNKKEQKSFTILELGAGTGDTLISLLNSGSIQITGYATEPNPSMEPHLRKNGIEVLNSAQLSTDEFAGRFDAVVCFEVLEHLLEPSQILASAHSSLRKGGFFFASTPNAQSLEVQLLKERSTTLDIEHISVLTSASIHNLALRNNFKVLEILTPGAFDLELIKKSGADVSFLYAGQVMTSDEIQDFISKSGFSSHQKCVFMKN
jgi:2-polyprenyl-3-methyl-5-hydroxy-6-metoxy-1,4-benzoquinol methylase